MKYITLSAITLAVLGGCASTTNEAPASFEPTDYMKKLIAELDTTVPPSENFDLTNWKITLPELDPVKGKAKEIQKGDLSKGYTDSWFYTDPKTGAMVFKSPNDAPTTPNSKNARSELRAMLADHYAEPKNNFVIASHPEADKYAAIGGRMSAALTVDWVSTSGMQNKVGAYAVVVGQIHAQKNEPLKIIYRKLPEHETGSLFFSYELNPVPALQKSKLRKDIRTDVFGNHKLRKDDFEPEDGIRLGELFEYEVNVVGDIMNLTFVKNPKQGNEEVKTYAIDLSKGNYQGHEVDQGYAGERDWMYYKLGAYNQCNTKSSGCSNRGLEKGDYTQVSFYKAELVH